MRKQMPKRELLRVFGRLELEIGQVLDHGIIPVQYLFLDEDGSQHRCEAFRYGPDPEHGALGDAVSTACRLHTVSLLKDDGRVADNGNRGTGNARIMHELADHLIVCAHQLVDIRVLWEHSHYRPAVC